jgi:YHS domain-containing protein
MHDGQTFYFCSDRCREKFEADRDHYSRNNGPTAPTQNAD